MARILDFYQVRWEYEPTTFPILWNLDGEVVESFAPDFYLPDLDVFLEMTTLKQRLVRKKNRKLRRLRELYPDIRIKLFYARDFRAMMLKYGRLRPRRVALRHARPGRAGPRNARRGGGIRACRPSGRRARARVGFGGRGGRRGRGGRGRGSRHGPARPGRRRRRCARRGRRGGGSSGPPANAGPRPARGAPHAPGPPAAHRAGVQGRG